MRLIQCKSNRNRKQITQPLFFNNPKYLILKSREEILDLKEIDSKIVLLELEDDECL